MMKQGLLALGMLALTAAGAASQGAAKEELTKEEAARQEALAKMPPFKAINYPIDIRRALSYGPDECKRQGGKKVTFAPDTVRKIDLNGDGRDDYIISFADTKCDGAFAVYCGTAGCTTDIWVTLPNGRQRMVFSMRVREYEILPGEGAKTMRFDMHGSYCGTFGAAECPKEHKITTRPFEFKEPKD